MPETRTTSSTGGQKGTKLARFDLIPTGPLTELAEHYGRGAAKYANHQWRNGYEWSKSYAAMMRHLTAFWSGLDYDVCSNDPGGCSMVDAKGEPYQPTEPDTCFNHIGSHHMAAVAWHSFLLLEFKDAHQQHDDRYLVEESICGEETTVGSLSFTCYEAPHDTPGSEDLHDFGPEWYAADRAARRAREEAESGMSRAARHAYATEGLEPDEDVVVYGVRDGFEIPPAEDPQHQAAGRWTVGKRAEDLVDAEAPVREDYAMQWVRDYDAEANGYGFRALGNFPRVETGLVTLAEAIDKFDFSQDLDASGFQDVINREIRRQVLAEEAALERALARVYGPDLLPKRAPRAEPGLTLSDPPSTI